MKGIDKAVYCAAMNLNNMAVFDWDIRQDTLYYDDMMSFLLQCDLPRTKVAEHFSKARLIHPKDRLEFQKQVAWLLNEKTLRQAPEQDFGLDFRIRTTGRYYIWVHLGYRVKFEQGRAYRVWGYLQNINAAQREKLALKDQTEHDPMTGLYSKTHSAYLVNQTLSLCQKEFSQHALLVIDLDNFKQVNDKLGHLIGDTVILDMAMNLKVTFRPTDILGHIGGDEFMVLMKDIDIPEVIYDRCDRLREMLRRSYDHNGEIVNVSASIGIALAPLHGGDYKTLFSNADAALYQSKRLGKDRHMLYSPSFVKNRDKEKEESASANDFQNLLNRPAEYILSLVFNSKDTALSVKILLDVFAKFFKVNRAYVFWHLDGPYWPRALFECVLGDFTPASVAHDAPVRRQMRKRYKETKYGRFTECKDTGKLVSDSARREFSRRQIRSYIECAVMDGEKFIGTVGFDDCTGPREWTSAEHEVLQTFADIMRRFLFGQLYYERMKLRGVLEF